MKVFIISDIKSKAESIIPYGLRLATCLEAEVEIIHIIDSRMQQGVSSNYGDSGTVTPANKLSHDEIIEREKGTAGKELDDFLSREKSRLNYPLKVNVCIELNSIENKITEDLNNDPSAIMVVNKEADDYIFLSQKEIIDVCKDFKGLSLIVPPGTEFEKFTNILLPSALQPDDLENYQYLTDFIRYFQPVVNVVAHSDEKNEDEIDLWVKKIETVFPSASVSLKLIDPGNFDDEFIDYTEMLEPDLVLVFRKERSLLKSLFEKELFAKLLDQTSAPILFHSR